MLNSVILDVAIGLIFMFCLVSLAASTVREVVEGVLKTRAIMLEHGIRELVGDVTDRSQIAAAAAGMTKSDAAAQAVSVSVTKALYDHPQIAGLFAGAYPSMLKKPFRRWLPADRVGLCSTLPSYIPSRNFAIAMLDYVARGSIDAPAGVGPMNTAPMDMAMIRSGLSRLNNVRVQRGLLSALDGVGDDLERARQAVGDWYDSGMDRVSGWYRRETQAILLVIGLILATVLNIDAVAVGQKLLVDGPWRDTVVAQAQSFQMHAADGASAPPAIQVKPAAVGQKTAVPGKSAPQPPVSPSPVISPTPVVSPTPVAALESVLNDNGFMIGGPLRVRDRPFEIPILGIVFKTSGLVGAFLAAIPGYLIVALAATLGAPFWFDLLNKLIVVRSTVKPHEKSREEGAKDGPTDKTTPDSGSQTLVLANGAASATPDTSTLDLSGAADGVNDDDDDIAALDPAERPREGNEVVDA
jgi:hypothetical protein